ncbi:hydrolase, putative [Pseudoalteromonas luteoviolacea B = ATCC 29581]|nr:hydrolase, putative [Pseudoalteromonas luteoviolacea B = ATCC 29581]
MKEQETKTRISSSYGKYDLPEYRGGLSLKAFRGAIKLGELIAENYTRKKLESLIFRPRRNNKDPKNRFLDTSSYRNQFTLKNGLSCHYYLWGGTKPDVLLVHGWESKAAHFSTLINMLVQQGKCVVAFDAVGHGNSEGTESDMNDFIAGIRYLVDIYDGIDCIIGYSFGGLALINAAKNGLKTNRLGLISAPASFYGIFEKVAAQLSFTPKMSEHLSQVILKRYGINDGNWDIYSAYFGVQSQALPLSIIHDRDDTYVKCIESEILTEFWPDAKLIYTSKLGHRGIIKSESALLQLYKSIFE